MNQQILEMLLAKYGNLSYSELTQAFRKDGLGELVDTIEADAELMGLISEISQEYSHSLGDSEYGIMPASVQQKGGVPVEYHEAFNFDPQACLKKCKGNCCKSKNYLMIGITDIFRILSSKGAQFFNIRTTTDLFDREPPFIELIYSEEYELFLPYIRYLPINADVNTRPEDAQGSICPFLYPIHKVYAYHKKALPQWVGKDARGCILMAEKPSICRLSPLGKSSGMVTGKVTYEYVKPALDCPACETDVEMKVSEYVSSIVSSSEQRQQESFHETLMSYYRAETSQELDQERFNEIIKHVYNIDALLDQHGLGSEHRPPVEQLLEITFAASHGDFSVYEQFVEELQGG